eukprot:evm.model.NODE_23192_length_5923_cov_19.545670.1
MDECCGWTPATATAAVAAVALGAVAAAAAAAPPRLLCVCRKPSEARRSQALKESQKLPLHEGRRGGRGGEVEGGRGEGVMDEAEKVETDCMDGFG